MTEDRALGRRASVPVRRLARIPDQVRVERYRLAPELGPRILFFSGGNALRALSRKLVEYTHNSIHIVTPFDSGGSSAVLRRAFGMPAVGDPPHGPRGPVGPREPRGLRPLHLPIPGGGSPGRAAGPPPGRRDRPLVAAVPEPQRSIVRRHLGSFREAMPDGFDLRRAAVGNLMLTAGYLAEGRNLNADLYIFSRLVEARGAVPGGRRGSHLLPGGEFYSSVLDVVLLDAHAAPPNGGSPRRPRSTDWRSCALRRPHPSARRSSMIAC